MWRIRNLQYKEPKPKPRRVYKREYWSNEFGWTWVESADTFSDDEQKTVNLPIGGQWEKVDE